MEAGSWREPLLLLGLGLPLLGWAVQEPLWLFWRRRGGERLSGGAVAAAGLESMVGAFEGVLLYLANTISFVRLAAYAMSHAALLMATFTLADQVRGLEAGGPLLAGGVILFGNVIAIVLEGIVAAVQALRLEYYEFFGKFYAGDGQPFRPFSLAPAR
jgi:V/A-type H+-transporting ATPase subunit I